MKVLMIAGEASGDLHGAGVVKELKKLDPSVSIFGIGGDKMEAAGMELIYHIRELSFMGFLEVIQHLPLIRSVEKSLSSLLKFRKPDIILLIDYPGFNLRFAKTAHEYGIKIVYYISPQVWAWNPGRVSKMKGVIDKMLVVFPFEVDIYRQKGIDVEFVGHPLLEVLAEPQDRGGFFKRYGLDDKKPVVGLFPGSRKQEIERIFPPMIGAARMLLQQLGAQIVVGVAPSLDNAYVKSFIRDEGLMQCINHATYDVMGNVDIAIVTSGTATLETGYFRTPMIVVYKTSFVTYLIGRLLIEIKNIGLVNIVAGKEIVPELIQGDVTPDKLAKLAAKLLGDKRRLAEIASGLHVIRENLGAPGASKRVADVLIAMAA
ncbi:MAG: lipid-A-disaccharide synthase [Bacteroidota bacterium]